MTGASSPTDILEPSQFLELEVGGKSGSEIIAEIDATADCMADKFAKALLLREKWQPGKREIVRFCRVLVRDLGLEGSRGWVPLGQILDRIKQLGHNPCEECDAPMLRLAYRDQPEGRTWPVVNPVQTFIDEPHLPKLTGFKLERLGPGTLFLGASWCTLETKFDVYSKIIFRL